MTDHHNEPHSNETKPVSFTVPFILACVTLTVILLLTSLGNPCHCKCVCEKECNKECMEACEKGDHSKHAEECKEENHAGEKDDTIKADTTDEKLATPTDVPTVDESKKEGH